MPKVKTLVFASVVLALSLTLIGCGMLTSQTADQDLVAGLDGDLPGWLLLSHRSAVDPDAEDDLLNPKDPEDESIDLESDEIAMGGSEEDDGVTPPSAEQSAPPASSGSSSASQQPSSSSSTSQTPKPGSREYSAWFAYNGATGSYNPLYLAWFNETGGMADFNDWKKYKELQEKEEAGEGLSHFWDDKHSPTGFGN